jgi:hypothetical protein
VKIPLAMGRLLTIFAIVSLVLVPVVRPAMALTAAVGVQASTSSSMAAGSMVADAMDEMPCCPGKPSQPDCSKDCPLMALCVTWPLYFASQIGLTIPVVIVSMVLPSAQPDLAGIADAPPRKPPKM